MEFKPKARVLDLVIQNSGSELLIYDLKTNTALSLNETSARIWRSCSGKRVAANICSYLEESDGVHVNQDLVLLAIRQLSDSNLLDAKMPDSDKSERVSRRKLLRQIGAGSAVALPIIYSIVAPKASAAATVDPFACTIPTGFPRRGTCPQAMQRCVDSVCVQCLADGALIPDGCRSNTTLCCSNSCNIAEDRCQ